MSRRTQRNWRVTRRKRPNPSGIQSSDRIFPARGTHFLSTNVSATSNTETFTENNLTISQLGDRLMNMADLFTDFRLTHLKVIQVLQSGVVGSSSTQGTSYGHAIAFTPTAAADYTAATTVDQLCDFPHFKYGTGGMKISFSVGPEGLWQSRETPWLSTGTVTSATLLSSGVVVLYSIPATADTGIVARLRTELQFDVEFRGPIDGAINPAILRDRFERAAHRFQESKEAERGMDDGGNEYITVPPPYSPSTSLSSSTRSKTDCKSIKRL